MRGGRGWRHAALLALALVSAGAAIASAEPRRGALAIVAEVTGDVRVLRADANTTTPITARVGHALRMGDSLVLGSSGTARVVVASACQVVRGSPGQRLRVGEGGLEASRGTLAAEPLTPCLASSYIDLDPDSAFRSGAGRLREGPSIAPLEPADLKVCTERPRFRWRVSAGVPAQSAVRVRVVDARGRPRGEVEAPAGKGAGDGIAWPAKKPALEPGQYRARYEVVAADGTVLTRVDTPFEVAPTEQIAAVRSHGAGLLGAMFADDFGCYGEALRGYRAAAGAEPPANVEVRIRWLGTVLGEP